MLWMIYFQKEKKYENCNYFPLELFLLWKHKLHIWKTIVLSAKTPLLEIQYVLEKSCSFDFESESSESVFRFEYSLRDVNDLPIVFVSVCIWIFLFHLCLPTLQTIGI